ncbi:putative RDD family membrane protein YckC [Psychromicrobium silvestre]|uniref:Putative RDD family membrane protein YckC n=1 Tax=Psychromicrobium silvestre TaxID=1645614 RepID=A0A7Y9LVY1_9MICC|nr:RDD family protein [Psychromicrobium silvestre]NYE96614.1 putative RDD family membrane protein YckC [Psychromicrobium silvestre]
MNAATLTCRNCGTKLAAGASFCTLCGAAVYNRAGRTSQQSPAEPLTENDQKIQIPGIIPVTPFSRGPVIAPKTDELGDEMARLNLVGAGAGKRLGAKLIDMVLPSILSAVGAIVGFLNIVVTRVNDQAVRVDSTWLLIWFGAASLLSLVYWVLLWFWEAKAGKTPGNLLLGLRTADMKGLAPGMLAIFVRNLIITIGFGIALAGGVLVMLSSAWDKNGKRQGWQDKAAHTLVFDIKAGRDPLTSGGIDGPASFAPVELPGMMPVNSPVAGASQAVAPQAAAPQAGQLQSAQAFSPQAAPQPAVPPAAPLAPLVISPEPSGPVRIESAPALGNPFAPPAVQAPASWQAPPEPQAPEAWQPMPGTPHPDEEAGETKFRPRGVTPSVAMTFDDGRTAIVSGAALIGRNPSGYDSEVIDQLIAVPDESRSISKTHLHVQAAAEGLWVTDRQSTNGSAVVSAEGMVNRLTPGNAVLAPFGSTIRFGDRSLAVGKA